MQPIAASDELEALRAGDEAAFMNETTAEAMSCQELVELVTAYLEDALAPDDHARFEQHLGDCGTCQVYVEQVRATIRLAGRVTPEDLSPEAERELLAAFRSWHSE